MMDNLESMIIACRGLMNLATFLIVASFYDPTARYRLGASLVAIGIAGFSFGLAVWSAFSLWQPSCACSGPLDRVQQVLLLGLFAILLALVVRSKGNIAKLLPRRNWSSR